eukprot:TRINITY_DN5738_c0_g1_i4.p1 TRINITY_DN5738_c0_g1~~TRINITY_DN5738_c0_g1_i4.p1  ORF type:complete len:522 (+),score=70.41 TRINITY_DN5738_c0_g1_i4:78-1643(+)
MQLENAMCCMSPRSELSAKPEELQVESLGDAPIIRGQALLDGGHQIPQDCDDTALAYSKLYGIPMEFLTPGQIRRPGAEMREAATTGSGMTHASSLSLREAAVVAATEPFDPATGPDFDSSMSLPTLLTPRDAWSLPKMRPPSDAPKPRIKRLNLGALTDPGWCPGTPPADIQRGRSPSATSRQRSSKSPCQQGDRSAAGLSSSRSAETACASIPLSATTRFSSGRHTSSSLERENTAGSRVSWCSTTSMPVTTPRTLATIRANLATSIYAPATPSPTPRTTARSSLGPPQSARSSWSRPAARMDASFAGPPLLSSRSSGSRLGQNIYSCGDPPSSARSATLRSLSAMRRKRTGRVRLHVYDISLSDGVRHLNSVFLSSVFPLKLGGFYHAGVEIDGVEWCYGHRDGPSTAESGIICHAPRKNAQHRYRETLKLGKTALTERDVWRLLDEFMDAYPASEYDMLHRNCCHFADELCIRLGVGPIPGWIHRFAKAAATMDSTFELKLEERLFKGSQASSADQA